MAKPEFHINDPVITTGKDPQSFIITGMKKQPDGRVLYCGDRQGWTSEEDLDYDLTAQQKVVVEALERALWSVRTTGQELVAIIDKAREQFNGEVPPMLKHEIAFVTKLLSSSPASKIPGALERSDLLKLAGTARAFKNEVLRYANEAGRFPDKDLKVAMLNMERQLQNVEDLL